MNKLITFLSFVLLLGTILNHAQVGINTETPQAMLDVNGNALVQGPTTLESTLLVEGETTLLQPLKLNYIQTEAITQLTGNETILVADLGDQNIVKEVSLTNLATGLNIPNANTPNTSLYKIRSTTNFSLVSVGINLGSLNAWQRINFPAGSPHIGNQALIDANGAYTVPTSGVYSLNAYFRYGTGVQASLLSATPQVGIVRRANGTTTDSLLDSRSFIGISLAGIASITFTEASINTIYQLDAGDKIYFALNNGGLTLGLLSTSSASFNIYKISGTPQ